MPFANVQQVRDVLKHVTYRDWRFVVGTTADYGFYLQVAFDDVDVDAGADGGGAGAERAATNVVEQKGRKWYVSPHTTRSELVQTALKAVLTAEEHEARERFAYRGKRIFGPHIDVDALFDACTRTDVRTPS